jgi:hypothetical protein
MEDLQKFDKNQLNYLAQIRGQKCNKLQDKVDRLINFILEQDLGKSVEKDEFLSWHSGD